MPQLQIVLVETTHPGNIGACARAMLNMGLTQLVLVNPQCRVDEVAVARASGALQVLDDCRIVPDLATAVQGSQLVIGTSARDRSLQWPQIEPRQMGEVLGPLAEEETASMVFGRESTGLSNEELDLCHYRLHIPCNPDFSSLNVAAAVQVISYEWNLFRSSVAQPEPEQDPAENKKTGDRPARSEDIEHFFSHLQNSLVESGFLDQANPRLMMRRLRRLFMRAHLTRNEVSILRGILSALGPKNQTTKDDAAQP